ncbi:MAG TPA: hypothetical protein VGI84_02710, partial [Pseudonocardiaceae bacterium]
MSSSSASDDRNVQFGPNEWLVEEMYEQFLSDPSAVDPAWHDFFADYRPSSRGGDNGTAANRQQAEGSTQQSSGRADTPTAATQTSGSQTSGSQTSRRTTENGSGDTGSGRGTGRQDPAEDGAAATTTAAKTTAAKTPASGTTSAPSKQGTQKTGQSGRRPDTGRAAKDQATADKSAADKAGAGTKDKAGADGRTEEQPRDTVTALRGAAARVVENMEHSLALPTATSVRAVPAKLLADNRIVINNHLKRTRGGKISFTHLIGYAVVRAL